MKYRHFMKQRICTFALALVVIATCALTPSAHAEIIYHSVNIVIDNVTHNLDLNGDGVVDFSIASANDFLNCGGSGQVNETPASGNGTILGPLHLGDPIGPDQVFVGSGVLESVLVHDVEGVCIPNKIGPWVLAKSGYLGFSLQVGGQTYCGWAKLINLISFFPTNVAVRLVGYAYENTPGMAIAAGQTK